MDCGGIALHFQLDGFRAIYGCIAGFLWLVTAVFSPEYFAHATNRNRYRLFNLLTFGAVMGVFFSADFRTTFLFFEVMSITSYAMVAHDESPAALRAAETYLAVAIIGGLAMLTGMLLLQQRAGTLEFAKLYEICASRPDKSPFYLPGALMLVGFGAKAGMYPLHIWLPKAHPVAPAPASALLSGILTKTGVFGVAAVSCNIFMHDYIWGVALLVPAVITMVLGAVLGVFSNDLKRTLACSSVSQIGFIITGVAMQTLLGEHNALAVRGTLLHMLNHSLLKLVLFVAAGVVYINMHELELNKIRGFGRGKPLFLFVFLMGALGICGVPLWSGYISKTLLHESIIEAIHLYHGSPIEFLLRLSDAAFLFAGGLTVAYMTKLFVALFLERGETTEKRQRYVSYPSAAALAISAALLPLLGCFTAGMDALADWGQGFFHGHAPDHAVHYFEWANLKGAVISAAVGAAVYFLVVRGLLMRRKEGCANTKIYVALWPEWLDLENLVYRQLLRSLIWGAASFARVAAALPDVLAGLLTCMTIFFARAVSSLPDALAGWLTWAAIFLARVATSLPDALTRLILFTVLRTRRTPYVPEYRHPKSAEAPAMMRHFSVDLLLVGTGICIALLYIFGQTMR